MMAVMLCASAEELSFCDSVPMQDVDWTENITLPKFDPGMGTLNAVDINVDFNLSQSLMIENMRKGNSSVNSTTESMLIIETPDGGAIAANASVTLDKELGPFDGLRDFSGSSGINLTKSISSGTVKYSSANIQDFVASSSGETVRLKGVVHSAPNLIITGTAYSAIQTTAGVRICISYHYD